MNSIPIIFEVVSLIGIVVLLMIPVYKVGKLAGKKEESERRQDITLDELTSLMKSSPPHELLVINPGDDTLNMSLGITRERSEELRDTLNACIDQQRRDAKYSKGMNTIDLLADVSKHCKHVNEVAYVCLQTGISLAKNFAEKK